MPFQNIERDRFNSVLLIALTLFGLAYLATVPFEVFKRKFDAVEVALFVALLIFNSTFLRRLIRLVIGSKGVELELLKIEQEKQSREIKALTFLITSYVTDQEMVHLTKLAKKVPFPYKRNSSFESELRRLRSLYFIRSHTGMTVGGMPGEGDLTDYFEITDKGIEYIRLRQDVTEIDLVDETDAPNKLKSRQVVT